MGDFGTFIQALLMVSKAIIEFNIILWKAWPVYMFIMYFGPAFIIAGIPLIYLWIKTRKKRSR